MEECNWILTTFSYFSIFMEIILLSYLFICKRVVINNTVNVINNNHLSCKPKTQKFYCVHLCMEFIVVNILYLYHLWKLMCTDFMCMIVLDCTFMWFVIEIAGVHSTRLRPTSKSRCYLAAYTCSSKHAWTMFFFKYFTLQ